MASDRDVVRDGLTRRALILGASSVLVPEAALAALAPTPSASEGPFYPVRMPREDNADLVRVEGTVREAGGDILHLAGRVLDAYARPIAGARIEIWLCDANGVYLHPGDRRRASRDTGFQGFGHATADGAGRTPHIHVKVLHGGRHRLTTQLYRADHPQNPSDFLFRRLALDAQHRVSMAIRPRTASLRPAFETEIDLVIGV